MDHFGGKLPHQTAKCSEFCGRGHVGKSIQWDIECSNPRHIDVRLSKIPYGHRWPVALSIHGLKEVAELSFQSARSQLANEIKNATMTMTDRNDASVSFVCNRIDGLAPVAGRSTIDVQPPPW